MAIVMVVTLVTLMMASVAQSARFRVVQPRSIEAAPEEYGTFAPAPPPSPDGTGCRTSSSLNGTAICNGVQYDFSQFHPSGGSTYFHAETSTNNDFYFEMVDNGLPESIPGCKFQSGQSTGNVGGLAVGTTLCFSTGKLESQQWYLDDSAGPQSQVITIVFTGGQQGLQTKLQVTCDPDQVQPSFPSTLPAQADPSIIVVPVTSKVACNDSPTRPPTIDGLPYCPDTCSYDWGKCIAAKYTPRQCLDFANKGFLCKSTSTLLQCDGTGFLKKQPICPGQMRFVSCIACTPTCQTPTPASCNDGTCEPGCKCPPATPIWDEAIASCVEEDDCPREGDCDQAIVKNYLGMPIADAFCPSRAQGALCEPMCEHSICVPRPSFEGRDKYATLCAQLDQTDCGARPEAGSPNHWSHRCIWADPTSGENPTFECNGGHWELTDPGSCPIGAGGSAGIVGPACRALATSQCLAQGECADGARSQCALKVQSVADVCKFPCIGIESGSTENMVKCARCVYNAFASNNNTDRAAAAAAAAPYDASEEVFGVSDRGRTNVTDIQTCCGCLPSLFAQLPGGFIPSDVLPTVMQSPCKMHDPLQDDDANMDDDEVHAKVFERAPSFVADPLGWVAVQVSAAVDSILSVVYY